ncbi:3-isopropylmalate dehydrogenase [soil metagenome]
MSASYRVAVVAGDGIGPEVTAAAQRVLEVAATRFDFGLEWQPVVAGGAAIDTYGTALREVDLARCAAADAVLLGAVGGPRWDDPTADARPEQALLTLRKGLGLFANLRPVTAEPCLVDSSPLRPDRINGVDLLIVRELTGGLYFGDRSESHATEVGRAAHDTLPYQEREIRRIVRLAFALARERRGRVTSVDKANVLATSRLWRTVATEVGAEQADIALDHLLVDSCAMQLITRPATFDVIVTENLFGDILSDEASVLAGSLGMLASASLGDRRTAWGTFGLYEPVHGSAPDIAGTDQADPIGAILSGALMLRWSMGRPEAARAIEAAVRAVLEAGHRTADLAVPGAAPVITATRAFTDLVARALAEDTANGAALQGAMAIA